MLSIKVRRTTRNNLKVSQVSTVIKCSLTIFFLYILEFQNSSTSVKRLADIISQLHQHAWKAMKIWFWLKSLPTSVFTWRLPTYQFLSYIQSYPCLYHKSTSCYQNINSMFAYRGTLPQMLIVIDACWSIYLIYYNIFCTSDEVLKNRIIHTIWFIQQTILHQTRMYQRFTDTRPPTCTFQINLYIFL